MKKQTLLSSLALTALVIVTACSSGTEVMSRWIEPGLKPVAMKKVLVIGIGDNLKMRKAFEETLSWRLTQAGVNAIPASRIVPKGGESDPAVIRKAIEGEGFDGALVSQVVNRDKTIQTTGGVSVGIGFSDYYGRGMVVGTPGPEAKMVDVVRLETSCWLFRDNAGKMVWTTLSQTTDISKIEEVITTNADSLISMLKKDGLI